MGKVYYKSSVEEKIAPGREYSNVVVLWITRAHVNITSEVIKRKGTLDPGEKS